jgi:Mg2+ and Co2+ transporter CorA
MLRKVKQSYAKLRNVTQNVAKDLNTKSYAVGIFTYMLGEIMDKIENCIRAIKNKLKEIDRKLAEKDQDFDNILTEETKQQIFDLENKIAASVDKLNSLLCEDGEKILAYRRSGDEEEKHDKAKKNAIDIDD